MEHRKSYPRQNQSWLICTTKIWGVWIYLINWNNNTQCTEEVWNDGEHCFSTWLKFQWSIRFFFTVKNSVSTIWDRKKLFCSSWMPWSRKYVWKQRRENSSELLKLGQKSKVIITTRMFWKRRNNVKIRDAETRLRASARIVIWYFVGSVSRKLILSSDSIYSNLFAFIYIQDIIYIYKKFP